MVFSSPIFMFFFLPLLLVLFLFTRPRAQNPLLLFCSLFFYVWMEGRTSWVLLMTIAFSLATARAMPFSASSRKKKLYLTLGITGNLMVLFIFKYAAFFVRNLNSLLSAIGVQPLAVPAIPLPLGISFVTFLAISFLVDTHRRAAAEKVPLVASALYVSFFPTIVAGPINPYRELFPHLQQADSRRQRFHDGTQRFIIGLGKKVLIADILAKTVNAVFNIPAADLTFSVSWLGIICFTLQIYFDFSGYSDMAIGLGLILGFPFMENFHYPYAATSIRDFWTRWHKSLTRWLRDYLFLSLAYKGLRLIKRERWLGIRAESWSWGISMFLTMLLCGLWHGAAWTFVVWGIYHGLFILLERFGYGKRLKNARRPFRHLYAILLVAVGWVFFRSASLAYAFSFLQAMAGLSRGNPLVYYPSLYLTGETVLVMLAGLIASLPLAPAIGNAWARRHKLRGTASQVALLQGQAIAELLFLCVILLLSFLYLANETYQPFIYFRF